MGDNDFIVFGAPCIGQEEIDEVVDTLESGWLGTGPKVSKFEQAFADYKSIDPSHVVAVNSCTAALHLSLIAAGCEPGDEVIVPAMTFCATVNAVIHSGATPVLADIDKVSMNIDPDDIERRITNKTKAIIPVHFAGRPCDMDKILLIARKHDLKIIEDCAHATESEYKNKKVGTLGDFGCFSFYVTKNITTAEGGMVISQNKDVVNRIRSLSLHGLDQNAWGRFGKTGYQHYQCIEAGFKYNMVDLQAAIGIHQLTRINDNLIKRDKIWNLYQECFKALPVNRPTIEETDIRHARHLYTLVIDYNDSRMSRDNFLEYLKGYGIGAGVHYQSIAEHKFYQNKYGFHVDEYPVSKYIGDNTVSLPLSPGLTDSEIDRICNTVTSAFS